jgi:hypothetical protein
MSPRNRLSTKLFYSYIKAIYLPFSLYRMTHEIIENQRFKILAEEERFAPLERDFINNTARPNTRLTVHVTLI